MKQNISPPREIGSLPMACFGSILGIPVLLFLLYPAFFPHLQHLGSASVRLFFDFCCCLCDPERDVSSNRPRSSSARLVSASLYSTRDVSPRSQTFRATHRSILNLCSMLERSSVNITPVVDTRSAAVVVAVVSFVVNLSLIHI